MNVEAIKSCKALNLYLKGDLELSPIQVGFFRRTIKTECKKSFYFFARYVLNFDLLTEQTHKRWCDKLQDDFWKYNYFMRLKPRKTFKTTVYGEAFILWLFAVVSPALHIFYTSANGTLLTEVSSHLEHYIGSESVNLYTLVFGIKRDDTITPNTSDVFNIIGKDKTKRGSSLMFRTAGGSVNGVHPHIIIIDDPMDKNDRESAAIRRKKEMWMESLYPLLSPYQYGEAEIQKIMFISTRWHLDDLVSNVIAKNKKIEKETDRFDVEVEGLYQEDGSLQYPEFFTEEKIQSLRGQMSEVFFSCQYLNNPLPEGLQVFQKDRLHFFDIGMLKIAEGSNYCFFDPSKGLDNSDFPAVIWVNFNQGKLRIFDAIDQKIELSNILKNIAAKNKLYRVVEMVFENNGTSLIEKTLLDEHRNIDYSLLITPIHQGSNKHERITSMQPILYGGSVEFREDCGKVYPELMNQMVYYPVWGNDDFPDAIEMASSYLLKGRFEFVHIGRDGVLTEKQVEENQVSEIAAAIEELSSPMSFFEG